MRRRTFLTTAGIAASHASPATGAENAPRRNRPLANEYTLILESPDAKRVFIVAPGICRLRGGRLVVATGLRGDPEVIGAGFQHGRVVRRGNIFTSDDRGRSWTLRAEPYLTHSRPFVAGDSVYVLGHANDLRITRSTDGGATWSDAAPLTSGQFWHQAPANVCYANGRVYLVMERITDPDFSGWEPSVLAPVLMSARVGDDLTRRECWTFSNELPFRDAVARAGDPRLIGVPFFRNGQTAPQNQGSRRTMHPIGWLETNVVRFTDPNHIWHDPAGRTFHLWMRAHTGSTNLACIAKAVESNDAGSITVSLEKAPSGEPMLYVPCPGGHMKFHILYDQPSKLYWLLSTQSTDSMRRPDSLPVNRHGLPNNERQRLALHFSINCIDWCFAGLVADAGHQKQSRHYASMVIDGEDLRVVSRSGDEDAVNAHDANVVTFHTIRRFRELIY